MIFSMVLFHLTMALIGNLCSALTASLFPRYFSAFTFYGSFGITLVEFIITYWIIRRYQVAIMNYIETVRRHAPILLWTINIFWSTFFYFKFLGITNTTHIPIPVYCLIAAGYLFSVFLVIRYLTRYFSYQELVMSQATEIQNLQVYTSHIEEMFDDLRRFRHDYKNILLSLGSAIHSGDLAATQKIYDQVVIPTNQTTESRTAVLGHLANIQDLEIKSLVYSKAMTAINEGLKVEIEVAQPIKLSPRVKTLDAVRMISILLDNAINAAKEAPDGKINFSLFAQDDSQHIVIGNSTKADQIPLQQLQGSFNGLTPARHSLGLRTLQIILASYPFIQHNRSSNHHWVSQELIIH